MLRKLFAAIFLAIGVFGTLPAGAAENNSIIGINLFPPLQLPNSEFGITGLRVSVVGYNRAMSGIDFALLGNITKQSFNGIAISGLFNYNQIAANITGLQVAALANINGTGSSLYGVQIGAYNSVTNVRGIQIGLVNQTSNLTGIQIGILNLNSGGPFKASPIINVGF